MYVCVYIYIYIYVAESESNYGRIVEMDSKADIAVHTTHTCSYLNLSGRFAIRSFDCLFNGRTLSYVDVPQEVFI